VYVWPCGDAVDLAQSDDLAVLHHDGADVALNSVAENDVTMPLQLLQKRLTLARRDIVIYAPWPEDSAPAFLPR
jgi:hypothetical protein